MRQYPALYPPEPFDSSGAFETCRVKRGRLLHRVEHLRRLQASCQTLGISPDPTLSPRIGKRKLDEELTRAARGIREGYLRVAIKRAGTPHLIIHRHVGLPYRKKLFRRGISVRTAATLQSLGEAVPPQTKHSERLSSILARAEGEGVPEVLRLGPHGYLTQGTVSNLFLVKEGKLLTPPQWLGALEGVTRDEVMKHARRLRIPVLEVPFTRHDLFNAQEAFLTNVLTGILPIRQADGRRIGTKLPGPVTRKLMGALRKGMK